jgi:Zn-finger nucleic acid-binding protein
MSQGFSGFGAGAQQGGYGDQPIQCPRDGNLLTKTYDQKANVTVDECSRCGGVWLDRGELQSIIASVTNAPGFRPQPNYAASHGSHGRRHHRTSGGIFGSFFSS